MSPNSQPNYSKEVLEAAKVECGSGDAPTASDFPLEINYELPATAICYLPLPHESHAPTGSIPHVPISKIDYSPMVNVTEVRPAVDRYSMRRYSPNEWRAKNQEVVDMSKRAFGTAKQNVLNSNNAVLTLFDLAEKAEKNSSEQLNLRLREVRLWKDSLERAIAAMQEEISTMESERVRLKKSLVIIGTPLSIAKECLMIRSARAETELVRDSVEDELMKEIELLNDISELLVKTLGDFEEQQVLNRAARERLEFDWSDKASAYLLDLESASLNKNSPTLMFAPGAVKFPAGQSSEECWKYFSEESMRECEKVRSNSEKLRSTLNSILFNAGKDIQTNAEHVQKTFSTHIKCMEENERRFMKELEECLRVLVETETRIAYLRQLLAKFDSSMKLAQTRMATRNARCNVEDCRDKAQQRLVDEVIANQDGVEGLLNVLEEAEKSKQELINLRLRLEHDIMLKRKSLFLDRDRCMKLRAHFPSASALKGAAA